MLNESSVWSGSRDNEADRPDAHKALPEIRRLLARGQERRGGEAGQRELHLPGPGLRPCQRRQSAVRLLPDAGQPAAAVRRCASGPALQCASGHRAWSANQEIEFSTDGNLDTKWCIIHEGRPVVWQLDAGKDGADSGRLSLHVGRGCAGARSANVEARRLRGRQGVDVARRTQGRAGLCQAARDARLHDRQAGGLRFFRFTFMPNPGVTHFQVSEIALDGVTCKRCAQAGRRNTRGRWTCARRRQRWSTRTAACASRANISSARRTKCLFPGSPRKTGFLSFTIALDRTERFETKAVGDQRTADDRHAERRPRRQGRDAMRRGCARWRAAVR